MHSEVVSFNSKTVPGTMIADHYLTLSEAKFSHLRRQKKRLRYLRHDKTNHVIYQTRDAVFHHQMKHRKES